MSDQSRAHGFAAALQDFEQSGEPEGLLSRFAADAVLRRPEVEASTGSQDADADRFWRGYLSPFTHIATEFVSVREAGQEAILEWESKGELATGKSIEYAGVSLLSFNDDDQIARFATYFDTAAFLQREQMS